jgi:hypothetical protein
MATYYSDVFQGPNPFTLSPSNGVVSILGKAVIPAGTAVATGDVIKLLKLPAGCYPIKLRHWNNAWASSDCPGTLGFATAGAGYIATDVVLETARATTPIVYINEGATDTGGNDETAFATNVGALSAADTLQITVGTVSGGTTTGEKYITFFFEFIDINSAKAANVAYSYNGQSSLVAGAST